MLKQIIEEIKQLENDRNVKKHIADGCDLEVYGAPIGKLKKLIKQFDLKHNQEIVVDLIESNIYDAVYLGFIALDVKTVTKEMMIKWIDISTYYKIRIHSLAYGMSEHPEFQDIIDYLANFDDDVHLSIYYATIAGRIIIDPTYKHDFVIERCEYVAEHILDEKYKAMPMTLNEMNSLIGYSGMQIASQSEYLIELAKSYEDKLDQLQAERKLAYQSKFILSCIKSGGLGRKRKSARC